MVGDAAVPVTGVRLRDTQAGDRAPAQGGDGVDGVPAGHAGEAPGRVRTEVPRALGHHDDIGPQDVTGRQEGVVEAGCLDVTAPGLAGRHGPGRS